MPKKEDSDEYEPIAALDPADRPPIDRYCDVVLEGGIVNGVVYPGFLMEIARKFHFHALAGASVGAIAVALAAACEYSRRFGSDNGFNEGLAKMPEELAIWMDQQETVTKIQSLFQPAKEIKPLFDWAVDAIGSRVNPANEARIKKAKFESAMSDGLDESGSFDSDTATTANLDQVPFRLKVWNAYINVLRHFNCFTSANQLISYRSRLFISLMYFALLLVCLTKLASFLSGFIVYSLICATVYFFIGPVVCFALQARQLMRMPGFGMCTGMRADGDENAALVDWLHEGIQKSAGLQLHTPLTFGELWRAPGGPKDEFDENIPKSIDLRMITTCLSQGRIYELPQQHTDTPIMFRLSELAAFFPTSVMDHLRQHSSPIDAQSTAFFKKLFYERSFSVETDKGIVSKIAACQAKLQKTFDEPERAGSKAKDIRILPASELPIVVAARMSMSCPVLFQAVPFLGLNLDKNAEDTEIVRLWFSDGGIGSNFPMHIFDQAIPKWPTFGLKLLDEAPRKNSKKRSLLTYIPFFHYLGAEDNLVFPNDKQVLLKAGKTYTLGAFVHFLFSIYTSAKDGTDQSYLRTPDLRNRVVRVYMNNRSGNALNLKILPSAIKWLAGTVGVQGGKNAAGAYLADLEIEQYRDKVDLWQDHRWVRMRMLIDGLRCYLKGVGHAINASELPGTLGAATLRDQITQAKQTAQLRSMGDNETTLTDSQAIQLNAALDAIIALEEKLTALDLPQSYTPQPQPVLRFKPQY